MVVHDTLDEPFTSIIKFIRLMETVPKLVCEKASFIISVGAGAVPSLHVLIGCHITTEARLST